MLECKYIALIFHCLEERSFGYRVLSALQLENTESFKYSGSVLTYYIRCTCEIKSITSMAKAALKKKKALFYWVVGLKLSKKLVKCYIWSVALYGAETGRFGQ